MGPKWDTRFELKPGKWVFVPSEESIKLGKKIKSQIEVRWKAPSNYFHLKAGGHVAALRSHLGQATFIHLDIQNFFDSINQSRITRCLKERFGYGIARDIAIASTVLAPSLATKKFILPYGFVQSPIIASICLFESALGKYLRQLRKMDGVVVSVYVDDIVISTAASIDAASIVEDIKAAAKRAGFAFNMAKEEGPADSIKAFNIELGQDSLDISYERLKSFREAYLNADSEHQRKGIVGYIESVNASQINVVTSQ